MYETHWGLDRPAFDESHGPESFVDQESIRVARAKLRHAVLQGQGAAAVTGGPGAGKTAIVRQFLRELAADGWATAYVADPVGAPREILAEIAEALGGVDADPAEAIRHAAAGLVREGRVACIAVDEVHAIDRRDVLESFRMLLNLEIDGVSPLRLVLVGQEGMLPALAAASGFDHRLSIVVRVPRMSPAECKHYILARLKLAGCQRGIFTRSAAEHIIRYARGVARDINRICELALTVGFGYGMEKIKKDVIAAVARDLDLLPKLRPDAPVRRKESPKRRDDGKAPVGTTRILHRQSGDEEPVHRPRPSDEPARPEEDVLATNPAPPPPPVERYRPDEGEAPSTPADATADAAGGSAAKSDAAADEAEEGRGLFTTLARAFGVPAVKDMEPDVLAAVPSGDIPANGEKDTPAGPVGLAAAEEGGEGDILAAVPSPDAEGADDGEDILAGL